MDEKYIQNLYNQLGGQSKFGAFDDFKDLMQNDANYRKNFHSAFGEQTLGSYSDFESLVKKNNIQQQTPPSEQPTTASTSEDISSDSSSEQAGEDDGILSKIGRGFVKTELAGAALAASTWKGILETTDWIVNSQKQILRDSNFFDEKIPDTDAPISDAFKKQLQEGTVKNKSPFDVTATLASLGTLSSKIILSALPQDAKNAIVNRLAIASNNIRGDIKNIEDFQEKTLPKNIPTEVAKTIFEMAPDLVLAAAMENPAPIESKLAQWTAKSTEKAAPIVAKYAPKAAKILEESVRAPFTKITAAKGGLKAMAETEEGQNPYVNLVEGSAKGAVEGMYMHGLGVAAGKAAAPISKGISKAGVNSAIATAIATPLANAGVFTTARALRTAISEHRMLTPEEAAMEAGTGIGFSLLHLGSQFKNHKELNHYYDNVLNDDEHQSFSRVLNETKPNLDIAYNPDLTDADVAKLKEARDEIKKAILAEPDLNKKQILGTEAIKIQNQIDAYNVINSIVANREPVVEMIRNNDQFTAGQKKVITDKINAIADAYDMSDFGVKKRELNQKIESGYKELNDLSEAFTDSKIPSDRATIQQKIDAKRAELDTYNNELNNLIKTKTEEDAVQKQKSDEALLRAGEQKLGLRQVGEGDTKLEVTPEQEKLVADEKALRQEQLDNPYDEEDLQDAKSYFENPVKYLEDKVSFWEDVVKDDPTEQPILDKLKQTLEAHKAMEAKPEAKLLGEGREGRNNSIDFPINKNGKEIGGVVISRREGKGWSILNASIIESEQGKGIGKDVYRELNKKSIEDTGNPLTSGVLLTKKAKGLWESLIKSGEAEKINDELYQFKPAEPTPETTKTADELKKNYQGLLDQMIQKRKELISSGVKESEVDNNPELLAIRAKAIEASKAMTEAAKGTTITVKAGEGVGVAEGEPTEVTMAEAPETKTALQQATEARKSAKAALDSIRQGMGIDPLAKTRALVDYHKALVREAKEFIKQKAGDISDWAKSMGEKMSVSIQKAWDEASGKIAPIEKAEDLGYKYEDIYGVEMKDLPGYEDIMDKVDFLIPKSKPYVDRDLKKAKEKYKRDKSEANKKALDKAKAAVEEYKSDVAKAKEEALKKLQESDTYKNANDIQKDELAREVAKRFGEKQARAPKPEQMLGTPAEIKLIMDEVDYLIDDANKSKDFLQEKYNKLKKEYDNATGDRKVALKEKLAKLKSEIDEYATKNIGEAITFLRNNSETYRNASKEQREAMENYIKDKFLKSQKEAVLPTELFGKVADITKVTITEKQRWKDQLKAFVRGIKNQAEATKAAMKEVSAKIDELTKKGSITAKQAATIAKRMSSLKVFDNKSVNKFVDYVTKVFADAEYDAKLQKANDLKKQISKLSSDKSKNAHLRDLAKNFIKMKTSMVDDIDSYIDIASKVKESLKGSKAGDENNPVRQADMVNIKDVADYIDTNLKSQRAKMQEEMAADILENLGIDATGMTMKEMEALLAEQKDDKKYETIIKDKIKQIFDTYSTIIKEIFETGKDPFTGEDMDIDASSKDLVKKFMGMDVSKMKQKDALEAMDALSNFLQNGSTAKMEAVVRNYQGQEFAKEALSKGLKASQLKFYNIEWLGRVLGEQFATLPMLEEMMFKGQSRAALFNKLSGLRELMNAKTYVQKKSQDITDEYVKKFYDKKTNGKDFTDQLNITERGIIASVKRTMPGTPEQQQAEFKRKKGLIEKSIDELKLGSAKERELADIYEEAYNKVLKDSENVDDVIKKSDKNNVDAVDFWIKKWADVYDQLADVSENVYNKILDKDIAYTPDKYSALFNRGEAESMAEPNQSLFHHNSGTVYKKMTGVLEDINRSFDLPMNEKTQNPSRYLDLSFDKNNANSMYDALMDINTAGVVRQIEAFFNSPEFKKIVPIAEDRAILFNDQGSGRVQDFVRAARNKDFVPSSEAANSLRKINALTSIGTATVLGNLPNIIKQTAPVALNTLINTRGNLDLGFFTGPKADFMDRIGYGISIRGLESQAQIKSINKLVDLASRSTGSKALELIEQANKKWLDLFLKNPDVYIAKASWISYYEKALKKQGIDPKDFDYSKDEVNKEAADYAQRMVDRQQNISDHDLSGKLLSTKDPGKRAVINMIMPFASFRLNQFMRATNDLSVIMSKDKSIPVEDRRAAARSLGGYGVEMAMFKILATGISIGMGTFTNYLLGKDETDEEYEKRKNNIVRSQITGTVTDIFSPLPPIDIAYAYGADKILNMMQDISNVEDEDKFKLVINPKSNEMTRSWGTAGIAIKKAMNFYEISKLASTGKFVDEYGRTKYISDSDKEALKLAATLSGMSILGILPGDANTIANNAISSVKRTSSTKEGGREGAEREKKIKQSAKELEKESQNKDEIDALNKMLDEETDPEKIDAINEKIDELSSPYYKTKEQREERKAEISKEKEEMEKLLQGYDNKTEMKRYDPELYEQTFGEGSKYYEQHKDEAEVQKEMNKTKREIEDEVRGYIKKSKKRKNKDGTYKRSYFKYSSRGY